VFLSVCKWKDKDLVDLKTKLEEPDTKRVNQSLLTMPGWPSPRQGCAYLDDPGKNIHWFLRPRQASCPLPSLSQPLPNWADGNALTVRFCVVEDSMEDPTFTLWLHHPSSDLGLRFEMKEGNITNLTNEMRWSQSRSNLELSPTNFSLLPYIIGGTQVECDKDYTKFFTVQPVWAGNLLFWRTLGMDGGGAEEPAVLSGIANVWPIADADQPINFYWDADRLIWDSIPYSTTYIHLFISGLEIYKSKE
jgi:hypothetical protein